MIYSGYADEDAPSHRGWLVGHFMPPGDPRHSKDAEIKWGVHKKGDKRAEWVDEDPRTGVFILVSGRFRIDLPDRSVVLDRPGAYVLFSGVGHCWEAEEDSVLIGLRWPSLPGY